ncbi:MAG: helix-turn-helix domain-containing protein [Planctomycetes bacterium]|nr:helix-turn-helix domain-containing protein [Planctomycetota bacterium]
MKRFDPTRSDFLPYGFTCEQWLPACMPRPNRHNEVELNLLTEGSLTYLLGGVRTTVQAGRLAVFWAAIPHQIVAVEGQTPYFVVTVPLSEFLHASHEVGFVSRILSGEVLVESVGDECDVLKFQQWERELRNAGEAQAAAARLEVRARLMRLGQRVNKRSAGSRPAANLPRADQIACYIARNYHKCLTAESIAEAVGVHPNYAMNLFRETFGTTMTRFITDHRISHAQRLLATTQHSILSVALAAGFQSLSRFNGAFKAACGCSPRDYRKAQQGTGRTDSVNQPECSDG